MEGHNQTEQIVKHLLNSFVFPVKVPLSRYKVLSAVDMIQTSQLYPRQWDMYTKYIQSQQALYLRM